MNRFFLKIVAALVLCPASAYAMNNRYMHHWRINRYQIEADRNQAIIDRAQKQKKELEYAQHLPQAIKNGLLHTDLRQDNTPIQPDPIADIIGAFCSEHYPQYNPAHDIHPDTIEQTAAVLESDLNKARHQAWVRQINDYGWLHHDDGNNDFDPNQVARLEKKLGTVKDIQRKAELEKKIEATWAQPHKPEHEIKAMRERICQLDNQCELLSVEIKKNQALKTQKETTITEQFKRKHHTDTNILLNAQHRDQHLKKMWQLALKNGCAHLNQQLKTLYLSHKKHLEQIEHLEQALQKKTEPKYQKIIPLEAELAAIENRLSQDARQNTPKARKTRLNTQLEQVHQAIEQATHERDRNNQLIAQEQQELTEQNRQRTEQNRQRTERDRRQNRNYNISKVITFLLCCFDNNKLFAKLPYVSDTCKERLANAFSGGLKTSFCNHVILGFLGGYKPHGLKAGAIYMLFDLIGKYGYDAIATEKKQADWSHMTSDDKKMIGAVYWYLKAYFASIINFALDGSRH